MNEMEKQEEERGSRREEEEGKGRREEEEKAEKCPPDPQQHKLPQLPTFPPALSRVYKRMVVGLDQFRHSEGDGVWWCVFMVLMAAAVMTRLHYITTPYNVVWDEAHFGKMVGWYINRTFFTDVHPPGGKLLLTLFGRLGGYNGTHSFAAPNVPYDGYQGIMHMRVGCALLGAGMVPLGFHSVWTLTHCLPSATIAATLIVFEVGTITLSKFILLDPPLFFFMMAAFHALTLTHALRHRPFSFAWWAALGYCGASLGCVMSVKFVGVFIVMLVGVHTALHLWTLLGNPHVSLVEFTKHLLARAVCLIVLPASIYISVFFIHDQLLDRAMTEFAAEEAHFSPGFQMHLKNNSLNNITQPRDVAYGSLITLRNANLAGVYLHSHNLTYPATRLPKNMQQVTGFRAKDLNNYFKVLFPEDDPDQSNGFYSGEVEWLRQGDWVRLYHLTTGALLSCGRNRSLVTRKHNIVYAKPHNLTKPENLEPYDVFKDETKTSRVSSATVTPWQMWRVHVEGGQAGERVSTLDSRIKFLCVPRHCALTWSLAPLPLSWGGGQAEITCSNNLQDPYTNWMVEQHVNPYVKNATYNHLRTSFVTRLVETHQVMTWVNARLKPAGEDRFNAHRPWMWPVCYKSQVWYDVNFRIVLLGNPLVFWVNLVFLLVAPAILLHHQYTVKRNKRHKEEDPERRERLVFACRWLLLGYLFHYLPFYTMDRILYYHHYFPALQFSSMLTGVVVGELLERLARRVPTKRATPVFTWALGIFIALIIYSFYLFCYVGYGHTTVSGFNPDNSTFRHLRAFEQWEI